MLSLINKFIVFIHLTSATWLPEELLTIVPGLESASGDVEVAQFLESFLVDNEADLLAHNWIHRALENYYSQKLVSNGYKNRGSKISMEYTRKSRYHEKQILILKEIEFQLIRLSGSDTIITADANDTVHSLKKLYSPNHGFIEFVVGSEIVEDNKHLHLLCSSKVNVVYSVRNYIPFEYSPFVYPPEHWKNFPWVLARHGDRSPPFELIDATSQEGGQIWRMLNENKREKYHGNKLYFHNRYLLNSAFKSDRWDLITEMDLLHETHIRSTTLSRIAFQWIVRGYFERFEFFTQSPQMSWSALRYQYRVKFHDIPRETHHQLANWESFPMIVSESIFKNILKTGDAKLVKIADRNLYTAEIPIKLNNQSILRLVHSHGHRFLNQFAGTRFARQRFGEDWIYTTKKLCGEIEKRLIIKTTNTSS